jgi:hypothetical protein
MGYSMENRLQGSDGRLLVVILSGPEDAYRLKWGLRLALHTHASLWKEVVGGCQGVAFRNGCEHLEPQVAIP